MQRVAAKDAIFLYTDTPSTHMHIAFAGVFDPSTIPGGDDGPADVFQRVRQLYVERLHLFPPFRWRIVPVPFNLHHPVIVQAPNFDIDLHLRRAALPQPGGRDELEAFISDVVSRKLDLRLPPWEAWIIEGLEGGMWAFVAKTHHVIVDGVGGNEALVSLLDLSPEVRDVDPPEQEWEPEDVPGDLRLLAGALGGAVGSPVRWLTGARETLTTAVDVVGKVVRQRSDEPRWKVLGPRTSLNGPVGPSRRVAFGTVSLDDVKEVKTAAGCTVNDVVIAMCGRGLRRHLERRGEEYRGPLVVSVPISVRKEDESGDGGNHVAGMTVPMHDDLDPAEQLARVHEAVLPAKEQMGAISATLLTNWSKFAAPAVATQAFRFYASANLAGRHPPIANVTLSNVPGPPIPLYLGGSLMTAMYPLGPCIHGQRCNITVVSYLDEMFLGVVGDGDSLPDVGQLRDDLVAGLDEITRAILDRPATAV